MKYIWRDFEADGGDAANEKIPGRILRQRTGIRTRRITWHLTGDVGEDYATVQGASRDVFLISFSVIFS
jgi:hypothetical protein